MFCPVCGSEQPDNTVFCAVCGTRLVTETVPEPEIPVAVEEPKENICPVCGSVMPAGAVFCAACGSKLTVPEEVPEPETPIIPEEPKENKCPNCGAVMPEGALFCAACGTRIAPAEVIPEPEIAEPVKEEIPEPVAVPEIPVADEETAVVPEPETAVTEEPAHEETPEPVIVPEIPAADEETAVIPEEPVAAEEPKSEIETLIDEIQNSLVKEETPAEEPAPEIHEEPVQEVPAEQEVTPAEPVPEPVPVQIPQEHVTEKKPEVSGIICPDCGTPLPEGALFCASCGKRLTVGQPVIESIPEPVREEPVQPVPAPEPEPVPKPEPAPVQMPQQPVPEKAPEVSGTICPNCGTQLPAGSAFCSSCGYNLVTGQAAAAAAGTPKKAVSINMPNVDLGKFAVLKDILIHPDKAVKVDPVVSLVTLILGVAVNSLALRNFYTVAFNFGVKLVKEFAGVSMKNVEVRQYRKELMDMLSGGKIFLWGVLITLVLTAMLILFSMLVNSKKEEKTDILEHVGNAARIMAAPIVLLLLAQIFTFLPTLSILLTIFAFILFLVLVIDQLKKIQVWPRTLIFAVIVILVVVLFGKGITAAGEEIFEEMLDSFSIWDLL